MTYRKKILIFGHFYLRGKKASQFSTIVGSHLGCVEKISELRLPNDEVGGALHRHSVLESHHGLLGQVAVGHLEPTAPYKWSRRQ